MKGIIGAGAFGEVFEAVNLKANVTCAVKRICKKRLHGSKTLTEAAKREISVLQQLDHPHIVHVLELLVDDTNMYMVMELMQYGNLMEVHDKSRNKGWAFTERDAANIVKQILMALNYMHKENVLHRDLKMENVMIDVEQDAAGNN